MSKNLISIIHEFQSLIYSQPPNGEYYKGDIIKWIENKLDKEDFENKRLLRTNFLNISLTYIKENINSINENVLNAQRVCLYFDEKIVHLKLNEQYNAAQLITLFRVLQKDLELFENTDEEVMEVIKGIFQFSKENIRTYFIREQYKIKAKKLFKYEWEDLT
jgi:hypothetical protein